MYLFIFILPPPCEFPSGKNKVSIRLSRANLNPGSASLRPRTTYLGCVWNSFALFNVATAQTDPHPII